MGVLGGELKRKEKLSARLGDILSLMFLCSATLKRFEMEGRQAADAPLLHWAIWDAMFKAQNAFEGVISNFPNRVVAILMRRIVFPLGRPYVVPSDAIGHEVAKLLLEPSATRDRLTAGMYIGKADDDPIGLIERALAATIAAEPIEAKLKSAIREGRLDAKLAPGAGIEALAERAVAAGIVSADEAQVLLAQHALVARVIHVDDFDRDLGATLLQPAIDALRGTGRSGAAPCGCVMDAPVYIVDGARTPFLKARNRPGPFAASDLATDAGRALLMRQPFAPTELDEVILGCAAPSADEVNIGRVARAAHGLRPEGARLDRDAQLRVGHAGDRLGDQQHPGGPLEPRAGRRCRCAVARAAPVLGCDGDVAVELVCGEIPGPARRAARAVPARVLGAGRGAHEGPHRSDLRPADGPDGGEPRVPLRHHAARDGRILRAQPPARAGGAEGGPFRPTSSCRCTTGRARCMQADDGVREDSTAENLAKLRPFFDRKYGNVTAGNSSQITDGGAWLVIASAAGSGRAQADADRTHRRLAMGGARSGADGLGPRARRHADPAAPQSRPE